MILNDDYQSTKFKSVKSSHNFKNSFKEIKNLVKNSNFRQAANVKSYTSHNDSKEELETKWDSMTEYIRSNRDFDKVILLVYYIGHAGKNRENQTYLFHSQKKLQITYVEKLLS